MYGHRSGPGLHVASALMRCKQLIHIAASPFNRLLIPAHHPPKTAESSPYTSTHTCTYSLVYPPTRPTATQSHRSKRRAAFRSSPGLAGNLTGRLMEDLEAAQGHLAPGWVPGGWVQPPLNIMNTIDCANPFTVQ